MPGPRHFCSLLLLGLVACAATGDEERPFQTRTLRTPDGETAHFVLFVPPGRDPAVKLPVILFLNGWGENGHDGLRQISNNFGGDLWRMRATFPFLAVCPQCAYNAEWTPGSKNADIALAVLDDAIREFNGDPDRVAITGASTGGTGALNIALANPERFAAVVPIAAPIHVAPQDLAKTRLPVWSFYNSGDSSGLVRAARDSRRRHFQAGASPHVTEFQQAGHNAWDSAYSSPALYRWLLEQHSGKRDSFLPFRFLAPEEVLSRWRSVGPSRWTAELDDIICHESAGRSELISPPFAGDWALHLDVQLAAGQPAAIAFIDSDGGRTELMMPLSSDGFVRLTSSGSPDVLGDSAAQRALRPGWNDIRLERLKERFSITCNGWQLLESRGQLRPGEIQVALVNHSGSSERRFRFLRLAGQSAGEDAP